LISITFFSLELFPAYGGRLLLHIEKGSLRQLQRQRNEEDDDKCNSAKDDEIFDG
jgi:hypothetical protein